MAYTSKITTMALTKNSGTTICTKISSKALISSALTTTVIPSINDTYSSDEWLQVKATDPKFWNYGDGTCQDNKWRTQYKKIMERWVNMTTAYNIDYMMTAGSLLGIWRNEDLIPWDYDLDVFVNTTDIPKLDKIKDSRGFQKWTDPNKVLLIMQEDWKVEKYWTRRRYNCAGKRTAR